MFRTLTTTLHLSLFRDNRTLVKSLGETTILLEDEIRDDDALVKIADADTADRDVEIECDDTCPTLPRTLPCS